MPCPSSLWSPGPPLQGLWLTSARTLEALPKMDGSFPVLLDEATQPFAITLQNPEQLRAAGG